MPERTEHRPTASTGARNRRPSAQSVRSPRSWSPLTPGGTYDPQEDEYWLRREISLLERALEDKGELRRGELGDAVGCKYWGPGRFSRALRAAVDQGQIRHSGLGRYAPRG